MTPAGYGMDHGRTERLLQCPVCGFDYAEITDVYGLHGSDPGEATRGVPPGLRIAGTCGERRGCVVICVKGECGHRWQIRLQQHRGQTDVTETPSQNAQTAPREVNQEI